MASAASTANKRICGPGWSLTFIIFPTKRLQQLGLQSGQWLQVGAALLALFKIFIGLLEIVTSMVFLPPIIPVAETTLTRYCKVPPVTRDMVRPSLSIGISSLIPSLRLPLLTFSRKGWSKFRQRLSPHLPV